MRGELVCLSCVPVSDLCAGILITAHFLSVSEWDHYRDCWLWRYRIRLLEYRGDFAVAGELWEKAHDAISARVMEDLRWLGPDWLAQELAEYLPAGLEGALSAGIENWLDRFCDKCGLQLTYTRSDVPEGILWCQRCADKES